jgi:hypothetical protein
MEERACQTPLEDLRKDALKHYDEASTKIHCWQSGIPIAINFYWDYKQMSLWQKLKQAFK